MDIICNDFSKIPTQKIVFSPQHVFSKISVAMLRLDLLHPVISGNKWFKLRYNLAFAQSHQFKTVLSFGGAYSNHLIATACAASAAGLRSVGIVRGVYAAQNKTETLQHCEALGMQLHFVSREEYAQKEDEKWLQQLREKYPDTYIIPEGGNNELGRKGIAEIATLISPDYTHVAVSVGSGATFAGLRNALPESIKLIGFAPMKQGSYLAQNIATIKQNKELKDEFHFGGFGKWNKKLLDFMNEFYAQQHIPLDVVYTAKMMYGVQTLIAQNYFPEGAKLLCIHTGGLQGNVSVKSLLNF